MQLVSSTDSATVQDKAQQSKKPRRKNLTKKTRFEVFKRDSFTCQYCGKSAPDVVLNADHIKPVSKGGTNEITNLVTACVDCNSGKSNRELSDDSVVAKQKSQMDQLQERRNQIEMMMSWRESVDSLDDELLVKVVDECNSHMPSFVITEGKQKELKKLLKKYGFVVLIESIQISADQYIEFHENGDVDADSAEIYVKRIAGVCKNHGMSEYQKKSLYIWGILRNRVYINVKHGHSKTFRDWIDTAESVGVDIDDIQDAAKQAHNLDDFFDDVEMMVQGAANNG